MKKFLNILLIAITLLSTVIKVDAAVLQANVVKANIAKEVLKINQKYVKDAQLEVKVVSLPFSSIVVPDGNVTYSVTPLQDRFMPNALDKIVIYVNGNPCKTFNAPVQVSAYRTVLVASTVIERDKTISAELVKVKRVDCTNVLANSLSPEMMNRPMVAKKYYREGEILDRRFVKLKPDVEKNARVQVVFQSNTLSVSVDGTALNEGMIGDYIQIENNSYKKIYTAKVVGENKVVVSI